MQRFAFPATLSVFLLLPFQPERPAAELVLAPKQGLVLEKQSSYRGEVELQSVSFSLDGENIETDGELPLVKNAFAGTVVTTDTYDKVGDGRVLRLLRSFDELALHTSFSSPEGDSETDDESPLEGATVVFDWSDEDEEYRASFQEEEGEEEGQELDAALLEDLEQSLDFELLLPGKEVEEGDEWTLGSEGLRDVLAFGGDFHIGDDDDSPQGQLIDRAFQEELEGTATCTYRGTREVDGRELHVIELRLAGEGHPEADAKEGDDEIDIDVHRTVDGQMDLEGELLWDNDAGHFAHLELKGEVEFTINETMNVTSVEEAPEQNVKTTFAGTWELEYTATAP